MRSPKVYTDKLKTHGLLDSKKISEFTNRILKEFLVNIMLSTVYLELSAVTSRR